MITVGVLGLQGAVREHIRAIEASGAKGKVIKRVEELEDIDGLVIPGGESTTMRRLIDTYQFMEPLKQFSEQKKPMFGTCAGLIILAKEIVDNKEPHLSVMDVKVERNSFGRQRDSFEADLSIIGLEEDFTGVFIRAPHIVEVGENVEVLSKHNGRIVAAKDGHLLGCSFHPELTEDPRMMKLFIEMIEDYKKQPAE
ncbi:pyridoxal 5'-phosphate synthase glutaminase subunit PdxT [Bacillus gobiensis]|uniref:pyridoxal 5'-phosphate synthase glutaminase subunit PdxT n=1 Tax=Bacillus gobiensis TaxID=1441095 RepID=UPI003D226DAE